MRCLFLHGCTVGCRWEVMPFIIYQCVRVCFVCARVCVHAHVYWGRGLQGINGWMWMQASHHHKQRGVTSDQECCRLDLSENNYDRRHHKKAFYCGTYLVKHHELHVEDLVSSLFDIFKGVPASSRASSSLDITAVNSRQQLGCHFWGKSGEILWKFLKIGKINRIFGIII